MNHRFCVFLSIYFTAWINEIMIFIFIFFLNAQVENIVWRIKKENFISMKNAVSWI